MTKKKIKTVEKINPHAGTGEFSLRRPTRLVDQYRFNTENNCLEKYTIEVVVNFPWEHEQVTITNEGNEHAGNSGISN